MTTFLFPFDYSSLQLVFMNIKGIPTQFFKNVPSILTLSMIFMHFLQP